MLIDEKNAVFRHRRGGTNVPSNSQGELLIGEFVPTSVVNFRCARGDNDACIATLDVLALVRDGSCHVAACHRRP